MTQVTEQPAPTTPAPPLRPAWVRGDDRWLGGCASGLAHRLGVDPALVRGITLLLGFIGGAVVLVYGLAWLILPDRHGHKILPALLRGSPQPALAVALAMILLGGLRPLVWFPQSGGWYELMVTYLVGITAVLLVAGTRQRLRRGRHHPRPASAAPTVAASAGPTRRENETVELPTGGWTAATLAAGPDDPHPTRPATTPRPRRRTPGPGRRTVLITLALAMLTGATILLSAREEVTTGTWFAVTGATIAVIGAGIVIAGLRSRRGGVLTALAVLTAPVAAVAITVAGFLPAGLLTDPTATRSLGEQVWLSPTTPDPRPLLIGDITIAPEQPATTARTTPFEATVGLGALHMSALEGESIEFRVHIGLGDVRLIVPAGWEWTVDDQTTTVHTPPEGDAMIVGGKPVAWITTTAGPNETVTIRTPAAATGTPDFTADLNLGLGSVTLTETPKAADPTAEEQN